VLGVLGAASSAHADEPAVDANAHVDLNKDTETPAAPPAPADLTAPTPEAPPPQPYKKTFVLDSSIGALGFLGAFQKVSPWGPWLHTQLGYELLSWLMLYGEGDLAFTDTSNRVQPPETRSFPIYGFGGGTRFTVRFTDRFGIYAQAGLGAMKALVGQNVLGLFGFRDAESLGLYLGGRLGIEWYQIDRHFGLGLTFGARTPQGFAITGQAGGGGTPIALDTGVSLRYAF
jgi:hypothetical protein